MKSIFFPLISILKMHIIESRKEMDGNINVVNQGAEIRNIEQGNAVDLEAN